MRRGKSVVVVPRISNSVAETVRDDRTFFFLSERDSNKIRVCERGIGDDVKIDGQDLFSRVRNLAICDRKVNAPLQHV